MMAGTRMETKPESEAELLKAIAQHADRGAFEKLYARMQAHAFNLAMHITGNPAWAEDAVQESMFRIWKHAHTFRIHEKPRAWILRIVGRESLRIRERMRATAIRERETERRTRPNMDRRPPASEQNEMNEALNACLRRMPEATRRILALRFGAEYSQDDIALALKIPQRTVSNRLKHALELLRNELSKAGLASAVTSEAMALREDIMQCFSVPEHLTKKVLNRLSDTGDRTKPVAPVKGSVTVVAGILCLMVVVSVVGGVALWGQQSTAEPALGVPSIMNKSAFSLAKDSTIDARKEGQPYHGKWTFNKSAGWKGLTPVAGGWDHRVDQGLQKSGCIAIPEGLYIALDVAQNQLPVRITGMIKPLNTDGQLKVNSFWSASKGGVRFHRLFPNGTFLPRNKLTWQTFELMVDQTSSTFRFMNVLCSTRLDRPEPNARICLGFESPFLLDDLKIDTIKASEYPNMQPYVDCYNSIPVSKRHHTLQIEKGRYPIDFHFEMVFIGPSRTIMTKRKAGAPIINYTYKGE